jgi:hypothetical protein
VVEILAANGPDESLHEGMRERGIRDGLDLLDPQDAQIGLPSVICEQPIMIGAEVAGRFLPDDGLVEQATQRHAIDLAGLHAKTDDASGERIHHDQNPVAFEGDGFTPEEVHTPQAVLHVPDEAQPRRPAGVGSRSVMLGKNASDHILVNVNAEGLGESQSDSRAAEAWVSALQLDDGLHEFFRRTLGAGLASSARRV